jgi:hypothetical protein
MRDKSGVTVKTILFSLMVLLALGMAVPAPVAAAPITGTLTIQGSVIVSATMIDWIPDSPFNGTFTTKIPNTGYFNNIVSANPFVPYGGQITDLGPGNPPPLADFLSMFNAPGYTDLTFDVDSIPAPPITECEDRAYAVGETCRLGLFILTQNPTSVGASFEVFGSFDSVAAGDNGTLNTANGQFSNTLTESAFNTIEKIYDIIVTDQGSIRTGWTATFIATAVPEPATLLTFGLGTAFLAAHRRRRAKKESKG